MESVEEKNISGKTFLKLLVPLAPAASGINPETISFPRERKTDDSR